METIEGNKLICDFMGWKHHEDSSWDEFEMANLKFHSSWDWIMPVVQKIEAIQEDMHYYSVVIENNRCQIFQRIGNDKVKSTYKSVETSSENEVKIIAVWQAIVKFLTTKPQPNAK